MMIAPEHHTIHLDLHGFQIPQPILTQTDAEILMKTAMTMVTVLAMEAMIAPVFLATPL